MNAPDQVSPYETILVTREGRVALITLNRPAALNALNTRVMEEVTEAARLLDGDDDVGCIIITGSAKAFAAGADIREMAEKSYSDMVRSDFFAGWEALTRVRKPIVAAVAGFALGGGCELAMMCDLIIAADTAKFGQPEVKLGVIPGHRRIAAPDPGDRQSEGDGPLPDRPDDRRGRGRALRPRRAGGPGRGPDVRGHVRRRDDRLDVAAGPAAHQGNHQPGPGGLSGRRRALRAPHIPGAVRIA